MIRQRSALGPRASDEAIARYAAKMHLDEPLWRQFLIYISNASMGDLGVDVFSDRPVTQIVMERLGFTLALISCGLGWAIVLGIPLGALAAVRPNSWLDRITGILSVGTIAIPSFVVSIWVLVIFAINLRWLPAIGAGEPGQLGDQLLHFGPACICHRPILGRVSGAYGTRFDAGSDGRELYSFSSCIWP